MIASLTGRVLSISNGQVVIDVRGVGYLVNHLPQAASKLTLGEEVSLVTSLVVREDAFTLYGFLEPDELKVFELLRSVNGVGPKSAMAILSELSVERISQAVASESDGTFRAVSGIGAKTAKLITLSLSGKFTVSGNAASTASDKALTALIGLGWSEKLAREAVEKVYSPEASEKEILKLALSYLSRGKR